MKKLFLVMILGLTLGSTFISCREEKEKTIIKEVPAESEDNDDDGGILERAGKKVDEEVNEEVDEEIENIGDDN